MPTMANRRPKVFILAKIFSAGVSVLNCKDRRDAIIIFCIDRGCSLQKVNEELYRFGEETVS